MKVFICIPWFKPAYKAGGPIQSVANLVEAMGGQQSANSRVSFKIFCSNKDLDGSVLDVPVDKWIAYNEFSQVWYSSSNTIFDELQTQVKKEKPGYLFINGIFDWQYNLKPLLFCEGVKKIISARGMLHPGALSQKSLKKKIYLFVWKLLRLHKKNIFHATDEQERLFIQQVFGQDTIVRVAANFPKNLPQQPVQVKVPGHLNLVSIALLSPMKNILLVLEALPLLVEKGAAQKIDYHIYGPVKHKKYWEACNVLINKMPVGVNVTYHGDVASDKIVDALKESHVFILPSKSENFGHAIYEALTAGRPVITSNNTPWNNLKTEKAGINVAIADTNELVSSINIFTTMDHPELEKWSAGAKKFAEKRVDINEIVKQYSVVFGTSN